MGILITFRRSCNSYSFHINIQIPVGMPPTVLRQRVHQQCMEEMRHFVVQLCLNCTILVHRLTVYEVEFHIYREIRECLRLDPEHKDCFPHYKLVKKVDKLISDAQEEVNNKDYQACIDSANKVRVIFYVFLTFWNMKIVLDTVLDHMCPFHNFMPFIHVKAQFYQIFPSNLFASLFLTQI